MRLRTLLIVGVIPLLALSVSRARQQETAPPAPRPAGLQVLEPSLLVRDAHGRLEPERLESLKVSAEVVGNLATTTLDLSFYNPQSRVLEGELVFPLGDGQRVSRFALEVDGRLREAVVVDKAKGRKVFEEIVRRGVDPGLLEQVEGNNYRARIYPIPARGRKRILVGYEQELKPSGAGLLYTLPLPSREEIEHLELDVQVLKQALEPRVTTGFLADFKFEKWEEQYRAKADLRNVKVREALSIEIPRAPSAVPVHYSRERGHSTFYAWVEPPIVTAPRPDPKRIALLWDVSGSSQRRRFEREWALLEAALKRYPDASLEVLTFSCAVHERRTFQPASAHLEALKAFLVAQVPDGGTRLGALGLDRLEADEILLSTDGLSNFGDSKLGSAKVPVDVLVSSPGADYSALHGLTDATGGRLLDLTQMETAEALGALTASPFQLLGVDVVSGKVKEVYPRNAAPVQQGIGVTGILEGQAELSLRFGHGKTVTSTLSLQLDGSDAKASIPAVRRLWAQKKLADLDRDHENNRDAIAKLSVAHGIVSRETSLIVLETLQDYLRYGIAPPQELREEYEKAMQSATSLEREERKHHLENVVKSYQRRIAWWDREFHPDSTAAKRKMRDIPVQNLSMAYAGVAGGTGMAVTGSASRAAMAPPPPPPPPPQDMQRARQNGDLGVQHEMAQPKGEVVDLAMASLPLAKSTQSPAAEAASHARIELSPWTPKAPYLRKLQGQKNEALYATYLSLKPENASSPGFYLDVAELLQKRGLKAEALRVLSNIAELDLENPQMLRILGHRLAQLKQLELARRTFDRVLSLREEDPQSARDLALVLADLGQRQRAVDLLWRVISTPWDGRFPEIESLACEEMNAIIARSPRKLKVDAIDARLLRNLPVDLRVVMTWDTDNCDLDLHVTDPLGELCYYSNSLTQAGGRISADFTQGFGPEEFILKRALPGAYKVQAHYFGDHSQKVATPTTLVVTFFTRFGSPQEKRQSTILRLRDQKELVNIGSFTFKATD